MERGLNEILDKVSWGLIEREDGKAMVRGITNRAEIIDMLEDLIMDKADEAAGWAALGEDL